MVNIIKGVGTVVTSGLLIYSVKAYGQYMYHKGKRDGLTEEHEFLSKLIEKSKN